MTVRRLVASLAVLCAVATAACGGSEPARPGASASTTASSSAALDRIRPITAAPAPSLPSTVRGTDGVEVSVTDVSRVIVLDGGIAEIVWSLGMGPAVVGRDVTTGFPEAGAVPLVTRGHAVTPESLLALHPTLVLADVRTGPRRALDQIRAAGVPILKVPRAVRLEQIGERITVVAAALGLQRDGAALAARVDREIAAARPAPSGRPKPRVAFLYLRGSAAVYLLGGRGSGADGLLEAVGAVDVGAEAGLGDFTPLTPEALAKAAPDVLLVMTEGLASVGGIDGLLKLNGVAQTPAGRARRVIDVDDALLLGFGPRTPAVLHLLADSLARVLEHG